MSTLVIFGGTGYAGGHIAAEAVTRGHSVISYSRHLPEQGLDGVEYRTGSITDSHVLGHAGQDGDDLVVAVHGADVDGQRLVDVLPKLVATALAHDVRLAVVGGAGSSLVAEGGPRLLARLLAAGVVDEVCLTLSPRLVGGPAPRILDSGRWIDERAELVHLLRAGSTLMGRWRVP